MTTTRSSNMGENKQSDAEMIRALRQLADRMVGSLYSYDEGLSEHYRRKLAELAKEPTP